jgi:hypothetical protein
MSTSMNGTNELDPFSKYNEPMGVGITEDGIEVWSNDTHIASCSLKGVLVVQISHKGEYVAIITRTEVMMFEVRSSFLSWRKKNMVPACLESGHSLQFSGDDNRIMMSSKMPRRPPIFDNDRVMVTIWNVVSGKLILEPSIRQSSVMANKFSFDLNSYLLSSGSNYGNGDDEYEGAVEDDTVEIQDFSVVDMEKRDGNDNSLEDGFGVNRHFESPFDEHGYVVRLVARHVNDECIMVLCVRTNGATMYMLNPNSNTSSAVASLYKEPLEGCILNGGISSDLSMISILTQTLEGPTHITFYDVGMMKNRFVPADASDEFRDNVVWGGNDKIIEFDLSNENNIVVNSMIDPEIFVSSKYRNATIYCTSGITSVFIDKRVFHNSFEGFYVSFSEPCNWFNDQVQENLALTLAMALHHRLGEDADMSMLDPEALRIVQAACVNREIIP